MPRHVRCLSLALLLLSSLASAYYGTHAHEAAHVCVHDALPRVHSTQHVRYEAHPFEGVPGTEAFRSTRAQRNSRVLAQSNSSGTWAPLRISLEWSGWPGNGSSSSVPAAVLDYARGAIIPTAIAWWSSALRVWPVAGPLTFTQPVPCGSAAPVNGTWAETDLVLRVYLAPAVTPSTLPLPAALKACTDGAAQCALATGACADATPACVTLATDAACDDQMRLCVSAVTYCQDAIDACMAAKLTKDAVPSGVLAFASTCSRDVYGRPTAAMLSYTPGMLTSQALLNASMDWLNAGARVPSVAEVLSSEVSRRLFYVTLHEICHALGFSASSIPLFRTATGEARANVSSPLSNGVGVGLPSSLIALPQERAYRNSCANLSSAAIALRPAGCVYKLATPAVAAAAAAHFACAASQLLGAELENQDTTMGAPYGSHWESRLYADELMSPVLVFGDVGVSAETLAFFDDSGWYRAEYAALSAVNARKAVSWGEGQGCEFATESCLAPLSRQAARPQTSDGSAAGVAARTAASVKALGAPEHYCSTPRKRGCTFDARALGTCVMAPMSSTVAGAYPHFQYFWHTEQPLQAGALERMDYCPIYFPTESCARAPLAPGLTSPAQDAGEVRGADARCVLSTLSWNASAAGAAWRPLADAVGGCYQATCSSDGRAVMLHAQDSAGVRRGVLCTAAKAGLAQSVEGFSGALFCPYVAQICGHKANICADGWSFSGTTLGIGLASAVAAALFACIYMPLHVHARWASAREDWRYQPRVVPPAEGTPAEDAYDAEPAPPAPVPPARVWSWSLLSAHPFCRLCGSFSYSWSYKQAPLQPGNVVHVLQYMPTPGWGACELHIRLGNTHLPPPQPLPPGSRGWQPSYDQVLHPSLYTVESSVRDTQGAEMFTLCGTEFLLETAGGPGRLSKQQLLRACGGFAGAATPAAAAAGGGASYPAHSLDGAFGVPHQRAAAPPPGDDGGITWSPYFYRDLLSVPEPRDVPTHQRRDDDASLTCGYAARPWRRLAACATCCGLGALLLTSLEGGLFGAAQQHACTPLWTAVLTRALPVACLTSTAGYVVRLTPPMTPLDVEMLPTRGFWVPWSLLTLALLGTTLWSLALNVAAASGVQLFTFQGDVAEARFPQAEQYAAWCDDASPGVCARRAMQRVATVWACAVGADALLFWPLLLALSRAVWKDGVAHAGPPASEGKLQEEATECRNYDGATATQADAGGANACAWEQEDGGFRNPMYKEEESASQYATPATSPARQYATPATSPAGQYATPAPSPAKQPGVTRAAALQEQASAWD